MANQLHQKVHYSPEMPSEAVPLPSRLIAIDPHGNHELVQSFFEIKQAGSHLLHLGILNCKAENMLYKKILLNTYWDNPVLGFIVFKI